VSIFSRLCIVTEAVFSFQKSDRRNQDNASDNTYSYSRRHLFLQGIVSCGSSRVLFIGLRKEGIIYEGI
jgi:hypothetical protein